MKISFNPISTYSSVFSFRTEHDRSSRPGGEWPFKTFTTLIFFAPILLHANNIDLPEAVEVSRGPHHRTFERRFVTEIDGRFKTNVQSIVELQSGLHRYDSERKDWIVTDPKIEMFQDGAVVRNLQYSVVFAPNLASPGAIDLLLPDGQRLSRGRIGVHELFVRGEIGDRECRQPTRRCAAIAADGE